jgi:hypothetical protein
MKRAFLTLAVAMIVFVWLPLRVLGLDWSIK